MTNVFAQTRLVMHGEVLEGSIKVDDGVISSIEQGKAESSDSHAVNWGGDYLIPGLVELHTDNMERHFMPRPRTFWPNGLAAVLTHDADVAAAGITTVFDSICVGSYESAGAGRRQLFGKMVAAVEQARNLDVFRCDHKLHFRCELSDPELMQMLQPIVSTPELLLVSLMDHTPGQRQWRDLDALRTFNSKFGKSAAEVDKSIQERIEQGSRYVAANRQAVLATFEKRPMVLASHDDTTVEHILEASEDGIKISEFPCSMDAARAASKHNMLSVGGAPNVVRGGSHSGNVAIIDLARERLLDGLSSDYAPASLLQAAFVLVKELEADLPSMIRLVSSNPAEMVGLNDRGRIEIGRRADFLRVKLVEDTPVIREVYVGGNRVA